MATVLDLVEHYQHAIDKYPNDEQKILKSLGKLFNLDVTVQHLQDTGVGRTVNALRKEPGEVGQAARALVSKWKLMVAAEESSQEDQNTDPTTCNGHDNGRDSDESAKQNSRSVYENNEKLSTREPSEHKIANENHSGGKRKYHSSEEEELDVKKSKKSTYVKNEHHQNEIRNVQVKTEPESHSDSDQSETEDSESEMSEASEEERERHVKHEVHKDKSHSHKPKHSSSDKKESSSSKTSHNSQKYEKDRSQSIEEHYSEVASTKDRLNSSHKHKSSKDKDRSEKSSKNDHSSSEKDKKEKEESKSLSKHKINTEKGEKHKSSKPESSHEKHKSGSEKHSNNSEKHSSSSEKHSSNSEKHSSNSEKHTSNSERHSSNSERHSSKSDKKSSNHSQKSEKDRHKSSSENEVSERTKSKEPNSDSRSSKEKHSSSSNEKSKDKSSSSKEKSDHSHKSEKKHSSSDSKKHSDSSKHKYDKKDEGNSESKSKHKSSSSSSQKSKSSKSKDEVPKKKVRTASSNVDSDDGIDCGSGASFAEALGMISPTKPKKKEKSSLKDSFSPNNNDLSPASMLAPTAKLAPLPSIEISALPEISPNYKPRPPPKLLPHFTDEEAFNAVISNKNQRTKVYSGNKVIGKIPSLYEMCVQVLQEHIDALEYTGGVPYDILKPVVDKASPQQLFMLEHYNPYLMEDTDHLWQRCCEKHFRNKQRQEMETWREMYMRCQEEQESRLKSLTANIRIAQEAKKAPIKQTKMAYVDTVVKPPRNIARKQALHGTAHTASASPAARVASLSTSANVLRGSARPSPSAPVSSSFKPKKAPLMQKALQFMRGRKR